MFLHVKTFLRLYINTKNAFLAAHFSARKNLCMVLFFFANRDKKFIKYFSIKEIDFRLQSQKCEKKFSMHSFYIFQNVKQNGKFNKKCKDNT